MIPIIYKEMCPNCFGDIDNSRLELGVCKRCLEEDGRYSKLDLCRKLGDGRKLDKLRDYCRIWNEFKEFEEFCKDLGYELLSIQKMWAKRVLKNKSFSIVAPTGVGKSFFGVLMSLYLASKGKRCYIILPTTLLVKQTYERALSLMGDKINVLCYHSELNEREKREVKERIEEKDFQVLITTSNYLTRNMPNTTFDFIFVDDVDALLKSSKNIDRTLLLLGFNKELIDEAYKIILLMKRKKFDKALELREKLKKKVENIKHGCIVIASATGKSYGDRVKLYRELLNFEVGYGINKLRDVVDIYDEIDMGKVLDYVKLLGSGGLIFISQDYSLEMAEEIEDLLRKNNIKAKVIHSKDKEGFEDFKEGKLDVLIGVASYYGVLVRGLDIPEKIRYAIFYGIPKMKFKLREYLEKIKESKEIKVDIEGKSLEEIENILEKDLKLKNFSLRVEEGDIYLLIPDIKTYIQASGRTSRMTEFGLTKGASILLVDDWKLFESVKKYMLFNYESEFKGIEEVNFEELIRKIDEDRKKIKVGKKKGKIPDILKSILMVVESPNKAKTIASFFGRPSRRKVNGINIYEVCIGDINLIITASGGHIFDLVTKEGYYGVKIDDNIYIPIYMAIRKINGEQITDQKDINEILKELMEKGERINLINCKDNIETIREIADEVDGIFIATDIDTEGEKIGYDIASNILPFNKNIYRIGFNEITRRAILRAVDAYRRGEELKLDENKVRSQLVRRIEDRWIGFKLSQKLWNVFNKNYLSAGRVQTPVLGWIIERYEEHKKKIPYLSIRLEYDIYVGKVWEEDFKRDEVEVEVNLYKKDISPLPPFTTDTLLEEATKKFYLSTEEVMRISQDLFELGLTTYHRTSSTRVSLDGMKVAREYLKLFNLEDYLKNREFYMEGPHECIRPTKPMDTGELIEFIKENNITLSKNHIKIYDLIFRRFIASQMKEATVLYQELYIKDIDERIEGYVDVEFDGWSRIYNLKLRKLPKIEKNKLKVLEYSIRKVNKVPLYDEGEVVKLMKERGIGRPSTYAQIIKKLLDRGYVIKSKNKGKLIPTKLGIEVYNYLITHYPQLISEEKTRELEEVMDKIERGEVNYLEVLHSLKSICDRI
ncbi:reverse gyrase [Methanofervidicoccus abyssi]|uniref:Reverse gyrase n=1 Tax=Methanofervidicoccus abyssi TaxID=2082189 RepID=A0A401HRH0_9EURY|nr:reverse gyrase [Methanofervidicoccus abyssi]GBF36866.1 reverse gyrase [Methanofervidicoccus abyssi]